MGSPLELLAQGRADLESYGGEVIFTPGDIVYSSSALLELEVTETEPGLRGDTASGGLARLDWSVPDDTDAVIVELGANDALRGVMIDGASLAGVAGPVAVVAAWGALSFLVAVKIFRWR